MKPPYFINILSKASLFLLALLLVMCKNRDTDSATNKTDSTVLVKPIAQDSISEVPEIEEGDEGSEGSYYPENIVIGKSLPANTTTGFPGLKFGDKVYYDSENSDENTTVFYLQNPEKVKLSKSYNARADYFIRASDLEEYQTKFSLAAFTALQPGVKKLILDNDYNNGNDYSPTQNEERSRTVVAYGDYDADGIKDVAIILDNNEKQISRLLIACTNKATKQPYLAFAENYNDKIRINSYNVGSRVFMNSPTLVAAPIDGLILNGEDVKLAIMYNKKLQKYKSYFQEAMEE
ncbi:hypothetical protein [Niabella ginsengisoli]|uniref:VCBS repeat-containing protein n=1 Tax=Niabella ginsengisoli TaxID=522298 RepID=A0ABS9SGJ2_9BACT|nr:hypothetical protein [Niabella ginsengisoli]MCH5597470.1 hypothetical protein [Niabella ginsengisoli]